MKWRDCLRGLNQGWFHKWSLRDKALVLFSYPLWSPSEPENKRKITSQCYQEPLIQFLWTSPLCIVCISEFTMLWWLLSELHLSFLPLRRLLLMEERSWIVQLIEVLWFPSFVGLMTSWNWIRPSEPMTAENSPLLCCLTVRRRGVCVCAKPFKDYHMTHGEHKRPGTAGLCQERKGERGSFMNGRVTSLSVILKS